MVKTIDLNRDLASLVKLEGRGEHTTEAEAQNSFASLAPYRDGGLFAAHFSGSSGWEKHPKGDELVQILEGETLLDRTMVLYGGNMGNASNHDNRNLPVVLAGGGFRHGQHVKWPTDRIPMSNLYLTILQQLGCPVDSFKESSDTISELLA